MKRTYILLNFLLILFLVSCNRQPNDEEFKVSVFEIKSIDPTNSDYTDLLPIKEAIGTSKIVLLGEQEHGDGSTYLAKSRLVKFLHQEMGFDVLAFESDFFGVNKAWDDYKNGKKDYQDVLNQMYLFWPKSQMCQNLFQTIKESQQTLNPIILTGFDNQQLIKVSKEELIPSLDSLFLKHNLSISVSDKNFFNSTLIDAMNKFHDQEITPEDQERFLAILDKLLTEFKRSEIGPFYTQVLVNIKGFVMHTWHWWLDKENDMVNNNYRDLQMANNCLWLLNEKYKGKKMIVWAANGHIIKTDTLFEVEAEGWKPEIRQYPMGEVLFDSLGSEMYSIGFTSYQGHSTSLKYDSEKQDFVFQSYQFEPADSNSFEFSLKQLGPDFLFIDLRRNPDQWNINDKRIRIWRPEYVKGKLSEIYDGIFYIHEIKPNEKVNN